MRRPEPVEVGAAIGLVAIVGFVGWLSWLMQNSTYDIWGALLIAPVLVVVSLPILARVCRNTGQQWLFGVAVTAMVVKLVASYARYYVAFNLYDGSADAARYHNVGSQLSELYRQGIFEESIRSGGVGTQFIEAVTGVVYAVTRPDPARWLPRLRVAGVLGPLPGLSCLSNRLSPRVTTSGTHTWSSSCPRCCSGRPGSARKPG